MSSKQVNVSRKKIISSQEAASSSSSSLRRDDARKKVSSTKKEEEKNVDSVLSSSSRKSTNKNDKSLVKQDSLKNSSSRSKNLGDKSVKSVHQSVKSTSKSANKIVNSPRISDNMIKSRLKTHISEEKRGTSTIFMPKDKISTSRKSQPTKTEKHPENVGNTHKSRNGGVESNSNSSKNKQESSKKRLPSRERRKSRTLSPSEVKVLNRNGTNQNAASLTKKERHSSPEYEYEDDFEDYESDFQDCTDSDNKTSEDSTLDSETESSSSSSEPKPVQLRIQAIKAEEKHFDTSLPKKYMEEERMLDSGHYELQEARRRAARIDLMSASTRINRANLQTLERPIFLPTDETEKETKAEVRSLPSSTDEGFEEGRSGDFVKSPPISGSRLTNDTRTRKDQTVQKIGQNETKKESKYLRRGRQLLLMIKLDSVSWPLYESVPIPYEDFIRIHGKMNTRQISTQTNDDNLSVDVQTEAIDCRNVWTQFPIVCRSDIKSSEDLKTFSKELLGVGSDASDDDNSNRRIYYDVLQLNDFILHAGKLMLSLLESRSAKMEIGSGDDDDDSYKLPFSESSIKFSNQSLGFLVDRAVTLIRFSSVQQNIFLTIHEIADDDVTTQNPENSFVTDSCIGCLWKIFEPSKPIKIFFSSSSITACCIHPTNHFIIFGGLEDGSLSLWDLAEDEFYHHLIVDKENDSEWTFRSPTFNSGINFDGNDVKSSKIVALTVLSKIQVDFNEVSGKMTPVEVCSLSENGDCIIWSVSKNFKDGDTDDLGQSWWGRLKLFKSHQLSLNLNTDVRDNFMQEFRDMCVDPVHVNSLYVTCNANKVLHVTRIGKKIRPRFYVGKDCTGGMTCIEICPFNKSYFFVGCEDGTICLFSSKLSRPLLQLRNPKSTAAIKIIQWSRSKPLTVYILDVESAIHIWDLTKSDISPTLSISLKKYGNIDSMQLSGYKSNHDLINQYIALGLNNGSVEIHKLSKQFQYSNKEDVLTELEMLLKYLSICEF